MARIRRARGWLVLATAGLTAAFTGLVAVLAPGHTLSARAATVTGSTTEGHTAVTVPPPVGSSGEPGLQPPQSVPSSSPAPVPVTPAPSGPPVSGGS